jgi:hypothetical protein
MGCGKITAETKNVSGATVRKQVHQKISNAPLLKPLAKEAIREPTTLKSTAVNP